MLRLVPFFLCLGCALDAATVEELVAQGTAAEARLDPAAALDFFKQADAAKPNDAFILQKIARQYSDQVPDQPSDAAKKEFGTRALEYAKRSAELDPKSAVNVLSVAICYGRLATVSDTRTRVEYSRLIKDNTDRSLQLDPNYAWAHHVLGRWNYEVAAFGFAARAFVRLFYGGLPNASVEEGINHLQRSTELEPGELDHWLELGFAYQAAGRKADARAAWERGLAMPDRGRNDVTAKTRARAALAKLD